ncbi:MAG: sodium:solute symporter family protein, partial [Candidatus Hydrogenedentota bacterium]
MLGISGWDWFTLALYGAGIVAIGIWMALRTRDREDFFIGGRKFGKLMMVFFSFGAGTNGNQAVAVASATYKSGMSGIWFQWLWLFATPFYWLIAPIFRRMRAVTTGDYFDMRYDRSVGALYSVAGILQLSANMGVMLLGAGTVITAVSGGEIPVRYAIPILTVLFVFYGVAGGLGAAILTD